ncbi:ADP-ribosylglycohydrolase family protein [Candidatus Saccharibacteria bacterium]|nr:ADP-ribosylglycohydrolase family protein [Candidatus Saccharibacteria bacterium]
MEPRLTVEQRATGALVGSAYGDSLGAPVEFMHLAQIQAMYGPDGIQDLDEAFGRRGNITDDTQMAIATSEGLLATAAAPKYSPTMLRDTIWQAYKRWYVSQSNEVMQRAPGNTCMSALSRMIPGSFEKPLNGSAGCGAIMRSHPIGVAIEDPERAFSIGALSGVLTHGHENAYVPAGFLSALTTQLLTGVALENAVQDTLDITQNITQTAGEETYQVVSDALLVAQLDYDPGNIDAFIPGTGGWLGHDALAISVYAATVADAEPIESVRISVNHSGDSDSTGAITGAIVGSIHGVEPFNDKLAQEDVWLEERPYLDYLAAGLAAMRGGVNG